MSALDACGGGEISVAVDDPADARPVLEGVDVLRVRAQELAFLLQTFYEQVAQRRQMISRKQCLRDFFY